MKWLETYQSESTRENYRVAVRLFLRCVCSGCTEEEYLSSDRDHEKDLELFFVSIRDKAPLTVQMYMNAVRMFFELNDIDVDPRSFKRLLQHRRGGVQTMDRAPTREELRAIVDRSAPHYRALFLLLSSSGMRIGEALALTWSDVDLEERSATTRRTKSGNPRVVFFSAEAQECLSEMRREGERIFTVKPCSARAAFTKILKDLGIYERDKNTGRAVIHIHSLRKYFFSQMSRINREMTEDLMGHEGYLTGSYRRFSAEDLKRFYRENESSLWVFSRTEQSERDRSEIEELKREIAAIREELKKRRA